MSARRKIASWAALALLSVAAAAFATQTPPLNIGHRGTGSNAPGNPFPENTIPGFEQALAEGADMLELDVTLSADNAVVVIHDDTLDRTTDCTGCVDSYTLAQIKLCDAAEGTSLQGTGVTVPTLDEVFEAVAGAGLLNIEIKSGSCSGLSAVELAQAVHDVIEGQGAVGQVIVSSFSADILAAIEALDSGHFTGLIFNEVDPGPKIAQAHELGFDAAHPYHLFIAADHVVWAHELGLEVNPWTVDERTRMEALFGMEVDGIITDAPDVLAAAIDDWPWPPEPDDDDDTADDDDVDDDDATDDDDAADDDDATGADDDDDHEADGCCG